MNAKDVLRKKLAEQIAIKRAVRTGQAKKLEKQAQDTLRSITSDTRVTRHMVESYLTAINAFPESNIPSPIELLDDPVKARELYDGVVGSLLQKCKVAGIVDKEGVRGVVDNPFTRYLSLVLGIPVVPFQ